MIWFHIFLTFVVKKKRKEIRTIDVELLGTCVRHKKRMLRSFQSFFFIFPLSSFFLGIGSIEETSRWLYVTWIYWRVHPDPSPESGWTKRESCWKLNRLSTLWWHMPEWRVSCLSEVVIRPRSVSILQRDVLDLCLLCTCSLFLPVSLVMYTSPFMDNVPLSLWG